MLGKRQSGFTLVEAVVSLLLLAVMSVMSYQAVEVILDANERSRGTLSNEAELHRAWQIINRDLLHLRPRVFADGLGSREPAYVTNPDQFGVRFGRGGGPMIRSNPSGVSRIEYRLNKDNQLERRSWPVTTTSLNNDGNLLVLLNNVADVEIEQLSRGGIFVPDWPPTNETHSPLEPSEDDSFIHCYAGWLENYSADPGVGGGSTVSRPRQVALVSRVVLMTLISMTTRIQKQQFDK